MSWNRNCNVLERGIYLFVIVGLLAGSFINPKLSIAAGKWVQKSSGATQRGDHTAVVHSSKMYVFAGGNSTSMLNDLWEYDIALNSWNLRTPSPPIPVERDCHAAIVYNGRMYIFGGYQDDTSPPRVNDLWEYDIALNSWTQKSSGATGRNNHSAVEYNGKIYIFGGKDNSATTLNDLWEYDITLNSWNQKTPSPPIPGPRRVHSAVVYNNKMYMFGGVDNSNISSDELWEYDFAGNSWTQKPDAPFSRADHSASVYNGKMYVFGGGYLNPDLVLCNDIRTYDFSSETWASETAIGTPPSPRYIHSAITDNGKIYIFGGENSSGTKLNDVWEYDIVNASIPTVSEWGMIIFFLILLGSALWIMWKKTRAESL